MKVAYIAHPIGGAVATNIRKVEIILEYCLNQYSRIYTIAPYLDACRYLDDAKTTDRARAFKMNKKWFSSGIITELWVCGAHSSGVLEEIQWARDFKIDIRFKDFTDVIEAQLKSENS